MPTHRRRRPPPPWVVKLGGSLAGSPLLGAWLDAIAKGGGRVVLVPGGGNFADAVRDMQQRWHFGDGAAHHMALLAMEQYGLMLAALQPKLVPASSRAGIHRALLRAAVPVWLPTRMVLGRPEIPESWDVTSDSLAGWLAGELGAAGLLLVKSIAIPEGSTVDELMRLGAVDPLLPRYLRRVPECRWIEAGRHAELARALEAGEAAGELVHCRQEPSGDPALADCGSLPAC